MRGTAGIQGKTCILLERDVELARVGSVVASAAAGVGAAVLVEGPAGIGKTALLRAAGELALEHGLEVLAGRGSELERGFGGGLVRQLFEPVVVRAAPVEREALLSGAAELAGRLVGAAPGEAGAEPGVAVLHGVYWLAANLAERGPLALVVDDIHWGDEVSLRFLVYLAHRIETVPVALVAAARTGEPGSAAELVGELAAEQAVELLRPAPLSGSAVTRLVATALGEPSPEFTAACRSASAGSPFLLQELLRAVVADGLRPTAAAAAAVERLVPASVSHAILLRLGRLPSQARELARAVAVLGPGAELAQAAELVELESGVAGEAFDALVAGELLADGRPLDFVHPLVRAAVYSDLPPSERSLLHARAATIMQRAGAAPDRLAAHLVALPSAGDPEVSAALVDAARAAGGRGSADTAIAYLRRALEEPPPEGELHGLLVELGTTESRVGDPRASEHLRQAQRSAPDDDALAIATLLLGRTLVYEGRMDAAAAAMQPVIDELAAKGNPSVMMLEGGLLAGAAVDFRGAQIAEARAGAARARVEAAERPPFSILSVLSQWEAGRGEPADVVAERAERAIVGRSPEDPTASAPTYLHAYMALIYCERYALARRLLAERIDEARRLGSLPLLTAASTFAACAALRQGELAAAEEHARTAVETDSLHAQTLLTPYAAAMLAGTLIERGELDEADAALRAGTPEPGAEPPTLSHVHLLAMRGRLRHAQGRFEEALESSRACGAQLDRHAQPGPATHPWRSDAALALHALGRPQEAARMASDELERAREFGAPRATGIALRTLGLVEGGDEGLNRLAEATRVLEGSEARLEHAYALCELGAALRRANRRAEAREPLRAALDPAVQTDARALRRRAEDELKATGARPRRLVLSGLDSLTASERRVARLAAEGHTNREIAQTLFVTARTVEGHLTAVYRKLDLSSREQLPAALAQETAET